MARTSNTEEVRPKRTSIADTRNILTLSKKMPGFHLRWVKDVEDPAGPRIERFKMAGYEHVTEDMVGHQVGDRSVDSASASGGGPIKKQVDRDGTVAYLMRQKLEYYNEDQEAKETKLQQSERALKSGAGLEAAYGEVRIGRRAV